MNHEYVGRCHCAAIGFTYWTELEPAEWSVRACQCSFCRAHGSVGTSDPNGSVEFVVTEPALMSGYVFGLRTATSLVCRRCGVYVGAVASTARGRLAAVNVRTLVELPTGIPEAIGMNFDGETREARLSRRERGWTPVVGAVPGLE